MYAPVQSYQVCSTGIGLSVRYRWTTGVPSSGFGNRLLESAVELTRLLSGEAIPRIDNTHEQT